MAKKIQIKSANDDGDGKIIMYAKPPVFKIKHKDKFDIENKVKSTEPILIKFFDLDEKGELNKELSDFCKNMAVPKVLTINEGGKFECELSTPGQKYFAYTVENKDAETLDPVIIIEDFADFGLFSLAAMIVTGIGGAALGAAGFALFTRKAKPAATSE